MEAVKLTHVFNPPVTDYGRSLTRPLRPLVLAVTLTVIVVIIALSVYHFKRVLVSVEQQAVDTVANELLAQLNFAAVGALTRRDGSALASLEEGNPLNLFGRANAQEAIAIDLSADEDLPPGQWVFDRSRGMLLYRFEHFSSGSAAATIIGLRSRLRYEDRNGDGRFDYPLDRFQGVALDRIALKRG